MKIFSSIVFSMLISLSLTASGVEIGNIHINGKMKGLEVIGHAEATVRISSGKKEDKAYKRTEDGTAITLQLSDPNAAYRIYIPINANVVIKPEDIYYEGSEKTALLDARLVRLSNLAGNVEFYGDHYTIVLDVFSASSSIVTYGHILGSLGELKAQSFLSLDSYLGNIDIQVSNANQYNIKATAKNGTVTIDEAVKGVTSDLPSILAYVEMGEQIQISASDESQGTKDDLTRQLIEIYLEDQGKNVVDDADLDYLRRKGYGAFIDALPEIPNWHRDYRQKHYLAIKEIMAEHGTLRKEDFSESLAFSGLQIAFINSPRLRKEYAEQNRIINEKFWSTELFQNDPNPFKDETMIGFNLSDAAKANLTVYNVANKIIYKTDINGVKGYNKVTLDVETLGTTGVLYYTLKSGDFSKTMKMIVSEK